MPKTVLTKTFTGDETFAALRSAEAFLASIGASVGQNQRGAPTGFLFGDYQISKWRGMSPAQRDALYGVIDAGDHRAGPITVRFYDTMSPDRLAALTERVAA